MRGCIRTLRPKRKGNIEIRLPCNPLRLLPNFAHLFFAALAIAALPAADKTRFFTPITSRSAEPPNAIAAARIPLSR
jgi:hypothetical protein